MPMIMQYSRKFAVPEFIADVTSHEVTFIVHIMCNRVFLEMDCVVLASFTARVRGIKFYKVLIA